jgi:glycosyltransferase involved in cell wall biosynthesis
MAGQLLRALVATGAEVTAFLDSQPDAVDESLRRLPQLSFSYRPASWEYEKWYSRTPLTKFASGLGARAATQFLSVSDVARQHREAPFDIVYQFSHFDAGAIRPFKSRLPPLVLHPETHIAGELRWHRRETQLAAQCESATKIRAVRSVLILRSALQKRTAHLASRVIAPSAQFGAALAADYSIPLNRLRVVPNPIDLDRYTPRTAPLPDGPIRIAFVSRMAVRKGVELVVALSRRLQDLEGRVMIELIGDRALWSDYRPLLDKLDARTARYRGPVPGAELPAVLRDFDLLAQPSHYEPFGLTVGEALASGIPVVVSDAVGAGEFLDGPAVNRFPTGDIDAFEATIRDCVEQLSQPDGRMALQAAARAQAETHFSMEAIVPRLGDALKGFEC